MMDRFAALRVFIAVAEAGGFSSAAKRLDLPLASVSRHVAALEKHLRTRLLTRTTRKVTLTEAGRRFLESAQRILEQLAEAERMASGEYTAARGELALTASVAFGRAHVVPVLIDFLKVYPEVRVRLLLTDRPVQVVEEDMDAAFRIGELADTAFVARPLGRLRRVICASPDYLRRHGIPKQPSELAGHACVSFSSVFAALEWPFWVDGTTQMFSIGARLVVTTAEAALDAAVSGAGLTRVLSYQAAPSVAEGHLRIVLKDFEPPPIPVSLLYPSARLMPAKLKALIDFCIAPLQQRLSEAWKMCEAR